MLNAYQKYLKKQDEIKREQEARDKPCFDSFDEYIAFYPDGEKWRKWVGDGILIPTYSSCLDGDFYVASIKQWNDYRSKKLEIWICINNGDDGMCKKLCESIEKANQEMENLKNLAPFCLGELKDFGYKF